MKFLIDLLIRAMVLLLTAYLLPGFKIDSYTTALFIAIVLAILNILVKPLLIILTLPVTILTLGLFYFVINAILLVIASKFIDGFKIDSFTTAIIASIIIAIISALVNSIIK
ncbi:hypothetical protein A2W14_05160 [Candidatus Gottesmanbacteria bacterium RBG_16_37_8]|uniref:Phage holin family protein n=1 Tax=Candidatus Gottesmanbacteria bacterium RBG_16_37_8 TaxID=1798371 RepID=A0A1F5YPY0_9BACT|nr:MAG: hypothetical protein A2W14_05160 [Candidatus Gottesmanbacteria bacterium RBG_16_37_8]